MKMPEPAPGSADKSKQTAAGNPGTAPGKSLKSRLAKRRRYSPPNKRREWYENAESQLAITRKTPRKPRQGD
jgi:hypothetical protein